LFADKFNGYSFLKFLKQIVSRCSPNKVFLIIDNAPWHNLHEDGKKWLNQNRCKLELFRLPKYSPEFNPMEPVWKTTRKFATHNQFHRSAEDRDLALLKTFKMFQRRPMLISAHVSRWDK